jgi:glyoxylase-like metal-dependent hydrolase (beta-lactamase superfamily II)
MEITTDSPAPVLGGTAKPVTADLAYLRVAIVNVLLYGAPGAGDREWVLIDAGLKGSADQIARATEERFGAGVRPSGIVLTHGHFDHVGALRELAERWDAPVYAHDLELPYLTGRSAYPPPDPTVGGGAMARLSRFYPRGPIDLGERVRSLPADGSVPGMPGWRWVHTPGHTAGHVSLFRDFDRTLIAGDAVVTTRQESLISVMLRRQIVWRPPAYNTCDWAAARRSVETIAALDPEVLATGHGRAMRGALMRLELRNLVDNFDYVMPMSGRYIPYPAVTDRSGVVHVPPRVGVSPAQIGLATALGAAGIGLAWFARARRRSI